MKTQVAIIGAGPAGTLLSLLLHQQGISSVVLERQSKEYVLSRIRAGVLEDSTVRVLSSLRLDARMRLDGHAHDGMRIVWAGRKGFFIDVKRHLGKEFVAYGQTSIQQDLYAAAEQNGIPIIFEAADVQLRDLQGPSKALVTYGANGDLRQIECDWVAGCDGYHGVSRRSIPSGQVRVFEKEYPFAWLGVLAQTPPLPHIVYANHPRGFALASMRSPTLSRYYIQVPAGTDPSSWSDEQFWTELKARFPAELAQAITTGPSIEKSVAGLKSSVTEPMRYGRLFIAGDAAHIVPPTGAKGLNLAVSDVFYLSRALKHYYASGRSEELDAYSGTALRRVWHSVRTSWYLTDLLHKYPDSGDFDQRMQEYELDYLSGSEAAQKALAEQYAGLPLDGI